LLGCLPLYRFLLDETQRPNSNVVAIVPSGVPGTTPDSIVSTVTYIGDIATITEDNTLDESLLSLNMYSTELDGRYDVYDDTTASVYWYVKDNLGSVRQVRDETGAAVEVVSYQWYSSVVEEYVSSAHKTRQKFTGKELDTEGADSALGIEGIGNIFFAARTLDPFTGAWNRPDPAEEYLNAYSYVGGNPVNYTDPYGLQSDPIQEAIMNTQNQASKNKTIGTESDTTIEQLIPWIETFNPDLNRSKIKVYEDFDSYQKENGIKESTAVVDGVLITVKRDKHGDLITRQIVYSSQEAAIDAMNEMRQGKSPQIKKGSVEVSFDDQVHITQYAGESGEEGADLYDRFMDGEFTRDASESGSMAANVAGVTLAGGSAAYNQGSRIIATRALGTAMNPYLTPTAARQAQLSNLRYFKAARASGRLLSRAGIVLSIGVGAVETGSHLFAGEYGHAGLKALVAGGAITAGILLAPGVATVGGAVALAAGIAVAAEAATRVGEWSLNRMGWE